MPCCASTAILWARSGAIGARVIHTNNAVESGKRQGDMFTGSFFLRERAAPCGNFLPGHSYTPPYSFAPLYATRQDVMRYFALLAQWQADSKELHLRWHGTTIVRYRFEDWRTVPFSEGPKP